MIEHSGGSVPQTSGAPPPNPRHRFGKRGKNGGQVVFPRGVPGGEPDRQAHGKDA